MARVYTPLYGCWMNMRNRCNNPNGEDYHWYGGRGIKCCPHWNNFNNFKVDMGPHPGKGWSLDRVDTNGDYEPSNCRWATMKTQQCNRRNNKLDAAKIAQIKAMRAQGAYYKEISARFGIAISHAHRVITGEIWR